jgi:hypothetical protein
MIATRDQALKALRSTPDGDYETRTRVGLVSHKAGLDLEDWARWLESHGHEVDRADLSRKWYLFSLVGANAMRALFQEAT